jgi:hypothetical protein
MADLTFGPRRRLPDVIERSLDQAVARCGPWLDHVHRVEGAGVDVFLMRDHFSAGARGPASRRERFSLSYLVTSDQALPALTEIIAACSRPSPRPGSRRLPRSGRKRSPGVSPGRSP